MDKNPLTKLYELIRKNEVIAHKKRQEFLISLLEGIIKSRSVLFSEIADKIDKDIQVNSIERRIQDFFKEVDFNYANLGRVLLSFIHHRQLLLSIDRTEWDFGKVQINILCVVVSVGKMGVPLYFEMLDNKSGNSNAEDRIALFKEMIKLVGKERIGLLVMDREFIGAKWLSWLKKEGIAFCVRVPKHHTILLADGTICLACELLAARSHYREQEVIVNQVQVNLSLSYDQKGDLLYLIGSPPAKQLAALYKRRWSVEVFFQALKKRGFHLEDSCLRELAKYKKLFAIVSLAYTLCWATGIQEGKKNPVKTKKHGYPQYSVFRRGLNLMRQFFKKQVIDPVFETMQLALIRNQQILI